MSKRIIQNAIKVVVVIAVAVFLVVPPRDSISFSILIGSIAVLFVCLLLWELLFGDKHTGQPDKPEQ
jgi:protein-S-isoprenylcysteine O-methyltransferase Ste14